MKFGSLDKKIREIKIDESKLWDTYSAALLDNFELIDPKYKELFFQIKYLIFEKGENISGLKEYLETVILRNKVIEKIKKAEFFDLESKENLIKFVNQDYIGKIKIFPETIGSNEGLDFVLDNTDEKDFNKVIDNLDTYLDAFNMTLDFVKLNGFDDVSNSKVEFIN